MVLTTDLHILKKPRIQPRLPIGVGGVEIGDLEKRYLNEVIESGRLSYGRFSKNFEAKFASFHDCRYAIMSNSGTSSLQVALAALKEAGRWRDGDEIIVPAVTFIATSNIVLQNKLKPVFVDVDSAAYNIDPAKIERAVTAKTRAVIPVHLFGLPCDMDPIVDIARRKRLKILEDSCETMFAKYKSKPVGSFGDIGCFSTYIAHILVTGVGGLATTNSAKLAVLMRSMINHGRDGVYLSIDDDNNRSKDDLWRIVERRFRFVRMGYSYRATEMEAALGLGQLENWPKNIAKRQANANYLREGLRDYEQWLQLPSCPPDCEHAFMMFPIVIRAGHVSKKRLVMFLESRGIETRDMLPLINQPFYQKLFGRLESKYPVARWINKNGFYIGCHPYLEKPELDFVLETFHDFFRGDDQK